MKSVLGEDDPGAPGGGARELDRSFDGLGSAVGWYHRRDPRRRALDELLRQHADEQADAELGEVRSAGVERLGQRFADVGVAASEREHAVAAQQIEVARTAAVDQIGTVTAAPVAVDSERPHDPPELGVQIAVVERGRLAGTLIEDLGYRWWHAGHG